MKRLFFKILAYGFLILLLVEALVRGLHLHKGTPERMIDEKGVEKWVPGQSGFVTTGNRRQNFSEYRINDLGFNSYREFDPQTETYEVALIGDSFIEGFHQDYYNSIGKKIERRMPELAVYEFGYAGYDLADELHLVQAYDELFEKIDMVVVYLHYPDDLLRNRYWVSEERLKLQKGMYGLLQHSKLLVYLQNIGFLNSMTKQLVSWKHAISGSSGGKEKSEGNKDQGLEHKTLENFKDLVGQPGLNHEKIVFLVDEQLLSEDLKNYLLTAGIPYIDYGKVLRQEKAPVTLIYDQHWNDLGRELVAKAIAAYLVNEQKPPIVQKQIPLNLHEEYQ
ncbi:hypothetical protein [Robertkochia sediminum]|uniref:hypothetical protein n=1 Tax=Robertkochia sediminum TaxID=2785326 RepID=UPI0019326C68|nr:hypothetical protein [Robertkochia sediminum]MBL7474055.1 hypothetical protein [Robertkochia sediminum]